jgi:hypothetical protein
MAGQTLKETVTEIPDHTASDKELITAALSRGIEHLDDHRKSLVLVARLFCVFLPEDSETAATLCAGTVALLKSPEGQDEADALNGLVSAARPSVDKHINIAIRKSRDPKCKEYLESIKGQIDFHVVLTGSTVWKEALSKCEQFVRR